MTGGPVLDAQLALTMVYLENVVFYFRARAGAQSVAAWLEANEYGGAVLADAHELAKELGMVDSRD